MNRRLAVLAVLSAALVAAVGAHLAIDILGDYLLPDDTYDHVAHASRELFTLLAFLAAGSAAVLSFSRFFRSAASIGTRVRLLRIHPSHIAAAFGAIALLALVFVPTMETIDTLRAGGSVDDLSDAFGGSLLLGMSSTLACAVLCCGAILAFVAWFARHRDRVASLIYELAAPQIARPLCGHERRALAIVIATDPARATRRRSKRGPPQTALARYYFTR